MKKKETFDERHARHLRETIGKPNGGWLLLFPGTINAGVLKAIDLHHGASLGGD